GREARPESARGRAAAGPASPPVAEGEAGLLAVLGPAVAGDAEAHGGEHTADRRGRRRGRRRDAPAEADGLVELADLPLPLAGEPGQLPVGVDGYGVADDLEHGGVGDRIGVGEGAGQVDAVALGRLPDGRRLVGAVGVELELAGVTALGVDPGPA